MSQFDLKDHDLAVTEVHRNLPPSALHEHAIRFDTDTSIAENGARMGVKEPAAHRRTSPPIMSPQGDSPNCSPAISRLIRAAWAPKSAERWLRCEAGLATGVRLLFGTVQHARGASRGA